MQNETTKQREARNLGGMQSRWLKEAQAGMADRMPATFFSLWGMEMVATASDDGDGAAGCGAGVCEYVYRRCSVSIMQI